MLNIFFFLMIISQFVASTSQVLLKKSAEREHGSFIKEYVNPWVIGGYSLLVISMIISIFCYKGLGYMGVVVIEPIGYVIVMFFSRIFFKEKITRRKILGMLLIVGGIAVFYGLG